ncbi:DUF4377 domain-containing protein [Cupriavidus basilensis]
MQKTISSSRPARWLRAAAAAVMLAAALGACTTSPAPDSPGAGGQPEPGPDRAAPAAGNWCAGSRPIGTLKPIPHGDNGEPIIFEFNSGTDSAQGTVSGYSGCNRFTGGYVARRQRHACSTGWLARAWPACSRAAMLESALLNAIVAVHYRGHAAVGRVGRDARSSGRPRGGDLLQFIEREGVGKRGARLDAQAAAGGVEKTVYVDSQRVECSGVGQQTSLSRARQPQCAVDALVWADRGLDFEPGITYTLRRARDPVENPPADASAIRWQLLSVESRTRAN